MITAIVLVLIGLVFVVAEVLFPSLGLFAVVAAGCVIAGDYLAAQESPTALWILIAVELVAVPLLLKATFAVLPRLPFGRGMILAAPASETHSGVERMDHLLGETGVAHTDLRPSGTAEFGSRRATVVSEGGVIEAGTRVRVTEVEGYRIVVRPVPNAGSGARTEGSART